MPTHDLIIRNGRVIDGTGADERVADIAIDGETITAVGTIEGTGTVEVDATGLLVTPGFVDVHTHYDGQATWDERLQPSSWHGVTTIVMGNCGVGFAPVHDADHDRLIELMEGVEDIPGVALQEGLSWDWNGYPSFLDAVDARPHDIDLAAQVPHAALRLHVMGERGANREPATAEEIAEMGRLAAEGIKAGALGFTTSRTLNHKTSRGEPTPTLTAAQEELVGIAEAIGTTGTGVLQMVGDFIDIEHEFETLREMVRRSGRPLSFSLVEAPHAPEQFRDLLRRMEESVAEGLEIRGQVAPRAVGIMLGLDCTLNPFVANPVFREIAGKPLAEIVEAMSNASFRQRMLDAHEKSKSGKLGGNVIQLFGRMYPMGDSFSYEPTDDESVQAVADREGRPAVEVAYDLLLENDGRNILYLPFLNYAGGNLDTTRELIAHDLTVPGLSDGGAHVGTICDAGFPTFLLTHWGRDRRHGELFPLPTLVQQHTQLTANLVGLQDRGVLAPGYRADINVIDFDALRSNAPQMQYDLPAGGRRVMQRAEGYRHTFVAGQETYRDGVETGALPGRLVRGAQPAPSA